MDKKKFYIILAVLTIVGSLFMVLASNMFFDDIFNIQLSLLTESTILVTIPAATVAISFVLATLYVIKIYRYPNRIRKLSMTHSMAIAICGLLGFILSIVSAIKIYGTLVGSHPFPGYFIIFMILNIALIALGLYAFIYYKKKDEDKEKNKVSVKYVFRNIGWFLFISLLFNRFGLFLGMPFYIYLRNLYLTFPAYLFLLVPLALGVFKVLQITGELSYKLNKILAFASLGCSVILGAYIIIIGINNTAFVSSLSQLYPLERMAAKPVELPIHILSYIGVSISLLVTNKKVEEK